MILIAIGGNLPKSDGTPALETCRTAATALGALPGLQLTALSRWYASEPVPPSGQPAYVNGVARLHGETDPAWLLAQLQAIEAMHGRHRSEPNAARTIDLDIIAMDGLVRSAPDPVIPHPRMHLRGFVLRPMVDVASDWVHPVLGQSAAALLEGLAPQALQGVRAV